MSKHSFLAVLTLLLFCTSSARADLGVLGTAGNYNGFFLNTGPGASDQILSTNSQGALAFGADTRFQFTNITGSTVPADGNSLVVGGNLFVPGNGDTISHGNVAIGGTYTTDPVQPSWAGLTVSNGSINANLGSGIPVNFASAAAYLDQVSAAQLRSGDLSPQTSGGALIFAGSGSSTPTSTFYDVSASTFANGNVQITGSATDTVVVNVTGTGPASYSGGITVSGGITADHILFNFTAATALSLNSLGFSGTILAPYADVTWSGGTINGSLIAGSLNASSANLNGPAFSGNLRAVAVPEPASVTLLALGGIGCGVWLRKQRRVAA